MPVPIRLEVSDLEEIYALFAAVQEFMGDTYVNTNVFVSKDSTGTTSGITATDKNGNTFTFNERVVADRLSVAPLAATLGPGGTQQYTATVTKADGTTETNAVATWSVVHPAQGTISASGLYMAPADIGMATNDQVRAVIESGATATVSVQLNPNG